MSTNTLNPTEAKILNNWFPSPTVISSLSSATNLIIKRPKYMKLKPNKVKLHQD